MSKIKLLSDSAKLKDVHVVFVHGLGGDADKTWLSSGIKKEGSWFGKKKETWPLWLLDDSEDLNIWSIEYSAPKVSFSNDGMGIPDLATNILERIFQTKELHDGEIIFVCHSLGGLVVKQILRIANEQKTRSVAQELVGRVSGVAFLATPHLGSDMASYGNNILLRALMLPIFFLRPSAAAASLSRNDTHLRELNTWYREWVSSSHIRHLVLTENRRLYKLFLVVKPDSADPGLIGARPIPLGVDHEKICKPVDKDDDIYVQVKGFVTKKKELLTKFG